MKIETITVDEFPLIIITDTHTNIVNIQKVQALYPGHKIICLGDITFMFTKGQNEGNIASIRFFRDSKIPCLRGNHDDFIGWAIIDDTAYFNISFKDKQFLQELPTGFKIMLPDGTNYFAFHNRPDDLWSFTEETMSRSKFLETYPVTRHTRGILMGHQHRNFIKDYGDAQLIAIGRLAKEGDYALLTEKGIEFKKLA